MSTRRTPDGKDDNHLVCRALPAARYAAHVRISPSAAVCSSEHRSHLVLQTTPEGDQFLRAERTNYHYAKYCKTRVHLVRGTQGGRDPIPHNQMQAGFLINERFVGHSWKVGYMMLSLPSLPFTSAWHELFCLLSARYIFAV